jgi:putative transposase
VRVLRDRFGVSERRACSVVGQHRSTQRLDPPVIDDDEQRLREFLRDFARRRPRWGWRRAAKDAGRAGWQVNDKRVRRLWRDEGLKVPYKRRKKRLTGIGTHVGAMCLIRPNALWALDFQFDVTVDGRTIKLLNVIDEFTRECPAIVVGRSIDADAVVALLDRLAAQRGSPGFLRCDIHTQPRGDRSSSPAVALGFGPTGARSPLLGIRSGRFADLLPVDRSGERGRAGERALLRTR